MTATELRPFLAIITDGMKLRTEAWDHPSGIFFPIKCQFVKRYLLRRTSLRIRAQTSKGLV